MTDAHFHRNTYDTFLVHEGHEVVFLGIHPWECVEKADGLSERLQALRGRIAHDPHLGVGEVGLDRLKTKTVPDGQREIFEAQLAIAAEFHRPVVLHGAKCWGEVVKACRPFADRIPAFLFHGFSRSAGLLPEIFAFNGFVSVGPALLNGHAVNYRDMVKELPLDRVLLETDKDWSVAPSEDSAESPTQEVLLTSLAHTLSSLKKVPEGVVASALAANAARFVEALA